MTEKRVCKTDQPSVIAQEIRSRLSGKTFFGLRGPMGAGKTTLISELLRDQKVDVSSPTFALYNTYSAYGLTIVHVDLYRLNSTEEIDSSGFWDLFADDTSVIFTEWVERISADEIPLDWKKWMLDISVSSSGHRTYILSAGL